MAVVYIFGGKPNLCTWQWDITSQYPTTFHFFYLDFLIFGGICYHFLPRDGKAYKYGLVFDLWSIFCGGQEDSYLDTISRSKATVHQPGWLGGRWNTVSIRMRWTAMEVVIPLSINPNEFMIGTKQYYCGRLSCETLSLLLLVALLA